MKYVQRRANRFEFRFPLPDDIAGKSYPQPWPEALGWCVNPRTGRLKTELIRSLKSNDGKVAERAALPLIEEAHRLVEVARAALRDATDRRARSHPKRSSRAREREFQMLDAIEKIREHGFGIGLPGKGLTHDGRGMTEDDFKLYHYRASVLDESTLQESITMRAGQATTGDIRRALNHRGIVLPSDDLARRPLELAFIKARRRASEFVNAQLRGEAVEKPVAPTGGGETLSSALAAWARGGGRAARKPREELSQ